MENMYISSFSDWNSSFKPYGLIRPFRLLRPFRLARPVGANDHKMILAICNLVDLAVRVHQGQMTPYPPTMMNGVNSLSSDSA